MQSFVAIFYIFSGQRQISIIPNKKKEEGSGNMKACAYIRNPQTSLSSHTF